jgi:hypothetical protein
MRPAASRTSWRRLWRDHGGRFLRWLEQTGRTRHEFAALSHQTTDYLISAIPDQKTATRFINQTALAHDHCDEPIYSEPLVVEAYVFLHFLERYRRCWRLLSHMVEQAILPMSQYGINVLDVGTGPGPTGYAVSDFYRCLCDFATEASVSGLLTPEPSFTFVELAPEMSRFIHLFSETARQRGPYHTAFSNFADVNIDSIRRANREALVAKIEHEDETTRRHAKWFVEEMYGPEARTWRFQLVVFGYFLTETDQVDRFNQQILAAFRSLTRGGILAVVGATGGKSVAATGDGKDYSVIYEEVDLLLKQSDVKAQSWPVSFVAEPDSFYTNEIKAGWLRVADHVTRLGVTDSNKHPQAWRVRADPSQPYRPRPFGARVYRREGRPAAITKRLRERMRG